MSFKTTQGQYRCIRLQADDLELYTQAQELCWQDKLDHGDYDVSEEDARDVLQATHQSGAYYWEGVFNDSDCAHFILLKNRPSGYDEIVGLTSLTIQQENNSIRFDASHILTPYREKKLSQLLYNARLNHVIEHTSYDHICTHTDPSNHPSIAAMRGNGFEYGRMHTFNVKAGPKFLFHRNIAHLRERPDQVPDLRSEYTK